MRVAVTSELVTSVRHGSNELGMLLALSAYDEKRRSCSETLEHREVVASERSRTVVERERDSA
jgi:hypothetical protein